MKKYFAELFGTFVLVLFGVGTAVIAGKDVGNTGIAISFGAALIAMAYSIGPKSGCHINPAVSLGFYFSNKLNSKDLAGYIISQIIGAVAAILVLIIILKGLPNGYDITVGGLGQNGWGRGFLGDYGFISALVFEAVATFIFVYVILNSTKEGYPTHVAGLVIGITLIVIHLIGIPITGTSVNPARSLAPAIFVGGKALAQVWLFLIVPSIAGILAGIAYKKELV